MSPQFLTHVTTKPSLYRSHAVCLARDVFLRLSKVDGLPIVSPAVVPLHTTRSRHKATIGSLSKTACDFLPLPALSSSSRTHFCSNLAFRVRKVSWHESGLAFHFFCAGLAGISNYQAFWLALYFTLNLALTLYNKALLISFPYPYTLTAVHSFFGLAGGTCLRLRNVYQPRSLWGPDYIVLVAFSLLYSVNIAISNASLDLVTVPFHQIVRAATPFFTTVFSWYLFNARFNRYQILSIAIIIFGVGLATYGDYYFTTRGLTLTLVGTVLAALKTILTHKIQTAPLVSQPLEEPRPYCIPIPFGPASTLSALLSQFRLHRLQLHPLDLLTHLSRLAAIQCIAYAYLFGEIGPILRRSSHSTTLWQIILICGNGIVACALNIVSFEANRRSGALSMGVAANVKQVLTVLCAFWFFHLDLTPLNAFGILLTLLGGGWYTLVEYHAKNGYLHSR
ncbi:triose-phosphate transporter family-domain-containing protein [Russula dissimulans]|nr:triose-phosphate transporter family-domain-containing protein [Russula dissimulans]